VMPEIVAFGEDGRPQAIDYGRVTALTVEAIRDQQREIENLNERMARLEVLLAGD